MRTTLHHALRTGLASLVLLGIATQATGQVTPLGSPFHVSPGNGPITTHALAPSSLENPEGAIAVWRFGNSDFQAQRIDFIPGLGPNLGPFTSIASTSPGPLWLRPTPDGALALMPAAALRLDSEAQPVGELFPLDTPQYVRNLPGGGLLGIGQTEFWGPYFARHFTLEGTVGDRIDLDVLPTRTITQGLLVHDDRTYSVIYGGPHRIQRFVDHQPDGPPREVSGGVTDYHAEAVDVGDGGALWLWREKVDEVHTLNVRRIEADGSLSPTVYQPLPPGLLVSVGAPEMAADSRGNVWLVWAAHVSLPGTPGWAYGRVLGPDGRPLSEIFQVHANAGGYQQFPRVVIDAEDRALITWRHHVPGGSRLMGRFYAPFGEDDTVTHLRAGRFRVELTWEDHRGDLGEGHRVPNNSDTSALLWFFEPDNWEMLIKVIDGCSFNGHHWVFVAATTDVAYTLTVTDTLLGTERVYANPLGVASPAITDTVALPCN